MDMGKLATAFQVPVTLSAKSNYKFDFLKMENPVGAVFSLLQYHNVMELGCSGRIMYHTVSD